MKKKVVLFFCLTSFYLGMIAQEDGVVSEHWADFEARAQTFLATRSGVEFEPGHNLTGTKFLNLGAIRPAWNRSVPYPSLGQVLVVNPPVFSWMMSDFVFPITFPQEYDFLPLDSFDQYGFQLSRSENFEAKLTLSMSGLRFPMYNPHKRLEAGKWYWRYRVERKGVAQEWSSAICFEVKESVPLMETPLAEEAYAMIPERHPRIMKPIVDNRGAEVLKNTANNLLKKTPDSYTVVGKKIPDSASPGERSQIEHFRLIYKVNGINGAIETLLKCYQLTQEEIYLNKAIEFCGFALSIDPIDHFRTSDFSASSSLLYATYIYDMAYDRLSIDFKQRIEKMASVLIPYSLSVNIQGNIGAADGILFEHLFQHTFMDTFKSVIIMKSHLPQAQLWFEMLYNIYVSRTPAGGYLPEGLWPNGNVGYFHVNIESMVGNRQLFKELFGVDLFKHPFYLDCANAMAFVYPPNSCGDGFADGGEKIDKINPLRAQFAYILGQELGNPFSLYYANQMQGVAPGTRFKVDKKFFPSYVEPKRSESLNASVPQGMPQAAVFSETGIATMHTDLLNADKNLFLSFYSTPFGGGSHSHAENNSFNLVSRGEPLFYPTGFRVTTRDKHFLLAQKHSRAKNTITVDGKTQSYASDGYGWIPRFIHGDKITYVMGDASQSYKPFHQSAVNWETVLKLANSYTSKDGFIVTPEDDPQVKLFRRHILMLRPRTIVIYDELEAAKPVTWALQLNGRQDARFSLNEDHSLIANGQKSDARAQVFTTTPLVVSLVDTNYVKPFDWLNPQRGRPAQKFEEKQYHTRFENREKCKKMRFLTIIQVDETNAMKLAKLQPDASGRIEVNGYRIQAELNADKAARLMVDELQGKALFLYGPTLKTKLPGKRLYSNSSILVEPVRGWQESIDRYPNLVPSVIDLRNNN